MAKQWFKKSMAIKGEPGRIRPRRRPSGGWLLSLALGVALIVVLTYRWDDNGSESGQARSDKVAKSSQAQPPADKAAPQSSDKDAPKQAQANNSDSRAGKDEAAESETKQTTTGEFGLQFEGAMAFANLPEIMATAPDIPEEPAKPAGPSKAVADWCKSLADTVEDIALDRCMNDGFVDTGSRSVQDRPLVIRKVNASDQPAPGRVLMISATHGDEPSSIGTAFGWMQMMDDDGTPYNWHVVPTLNPDGVFDSPATRVNANGVDLNRNLPTTGWARESRDYWRRVGFEKRRFPGKAPGSEPENQWLVKEIREFEPDVIVALHAPYGVLDYDGKFPAPRKLGDLRLHRLGVYPGSLGNFASRMQGIPVITIELEDAHKAPSSSEMKEMWADLNGWLDRYMRSVRQARSGDGGDAG